MPKAKKMKTSRPKTFASMGMHPTKSWASMPISVNTLTFRVAREGRRMRKTRTTVTGLLKEAAGMSSTTPMAKQAASRQFHLRDANRVTTIRGLVHWETKCKI